MHYLLRLGLCLAIVGLLAPPLLFAQEETQETQSENQNKTNTPAPADQATQAGDIPASRSSVGPRTLNDSTYTAKPPAFGRNQRHFVHPVFGFHWMVGASQEGSPQVMHNKSFTFDAGLRYKLKATNWLAFTLDAYYRNQKIRMIPNSIFPDALENATEQFSMPGFGSALAVRFNFDPKRGNDIGFFLDVGGNLFVPINPKYITGNEDPLSDSYLTLIRTRLDYIRQVRPGLVARLGWRNLALQLEYDLTTPFIEGGSDIDLPRFKLGFALGIH